MLEVDMVFEGKTLVACCLANAAGPATLLADLNSGASLPAALLLVHLEPTLAVEDAMAERAL